MRRSPWLRTVFLLLLAAGLIGYVSACTPSATPASPQASEKPAQPTQAPAAVEPTRAPEASEAPKPTLPPEAPATEATAQPGPTYPPVVTIAPALPTLLPPQVRVESRLVELEWPRELRLGDSDIIRLALVPYQDGYQVQAEFPEHALQTQPVPVERPSGYILSAVARLDGVGFEIAPTGDQERFLPPDEAVAWRWTLRPRSAGQQRLSIQLLLRWTPGEGRSGAPRQTVIYSKGLDVQVTSFFGMDRAQAMTTGFFGVLLGGGLSLFALVYRPRPALPRLQSRQPNERLVIEPRPGLHLGAEERKLLQALFGRYGRLVLEREFLSGYSGARTFLALPLKTDGRADASTIVKIGESESIRREFINYEAYVKDSLPPITARIQHAPVTTGDSDRAALQYTFIAEPGRLPLSLRQALLETPDPALLWKMFETFGPNWWMQRSAYAFRMAQEYDRILPPHYVLQPLPAGGRASRTLSENDTPAGLDLQIGQVLRVERFAHFERRMDGRSLTLLCKAAAGQPALRLRWLDTRPPERSLAQVVATRAALLADLTAGLERPAPLPDPLACLPAVLNEAVMGTRAIIHGDLNLENVLVGPGNFVWLIDFAQTREGHTLYDFAHLEEELIAHVLAEATFTPDAFVTMLRSRSNPLLAAVEEIAHRCLFNPGQRREYDLARYAVCLGALKYANLTPAARQCLYLNAAYHCQQLQ